MRKFRFYCLGLYSFFFSFSYGQNFDEEVSRYKKLISDAKHDTIKIRFNSELATLYSKNNDDTSILYQEEALKIAESYGDDKIIANNLIVLIEKFLRFGRYPEAIEVMNKANKFNIHFKNHHFQTKVHMRRAWTLDAIQQHDSAIYYANKAIQSNLKGENDKTIEADVYIIKAGSEALRNNEIKATEYYLIALDISEKANYKDGILLSLVNLASRFVESGDLKKAEHYTREYIKISEGNLTSKAYGDYLLSRIFFEQKQYDSTLVYSKKALDTYKELNRTVFLSELYMHLGICYNALENYPKAAAMYELVITNDQTPNKHITFKAFLNLSETYVNIGDVSKAKVYLDSASTYLKKEKYVTNHSENISYLHYLINEKEKNYEKAHFYYKQYKNITDSIKNEASNLKISELETAYQVEKKEKEITSLNAKNKIKNLQLYLLIGISLISSLVLLIVYYRFRSNKKIKEQLVETDKIKSRFFTNISHEFRTPLALIQGSLQNEIEEVKNNKNLDVAYRNTSRLKQLIDQLLDISKIEAGSMKLLVEKTNLTQFIKVIYSFFSSKAKEKQINYVLSIEEEELLGYADTIKLEKIIINLLSNAFKFTPEGGTIKIDVKLIFDTLQIGVSDTGSGIVEKDLKKIFDRFYQGNTTSNRSIVEGTGIGLALSSELAQIHKGTLTVESIVGKGSNFILTIPITKNSYNHSEINLNNESNSVGKSVCVEGNTIRKTQTIDQELPLIIIAEDNTDMQQYIYDILSDYYQVIIASDGKEAYILAEENVPTLIVSDYMMPEMDGLALCENLKNNTATSHIPVIMLTARADEADKLKSLEQGANAYLTKPFNKKELLLTVQNQIALIERYKDWYENQSTISTDNFKNLPKEQAFINKINLLLEEKFSDEDYGVHQFSEDLCLSRMQTYRKVKALTGKSPVDLLRTFRLEKAKLLLESSSMDIGQISVSSGFKNHSNFSKVFKEFVGCTPVEYVEKFQNKL